MRSWNRRSFLAASAGLAFLAPHAEPVLRYLARSFATHEADRTYLPNLERVRKTLPALRAGWTAGEPNRQATLEPR